ncbi:MAG: cation:proton antiporter [Opitutus sp.]
MNFGAWMLVLGALLLVMALIQPSIQRLPVTGTIVYLLIGIAFGPKGLGIIQIDPVAKASWLLHATELAVIVSLFTVGMKLRLHPGARRLRPAICLASVSMLITVALLTLAGFLLLHLSWGAALLLAAILAPTDPVLASDVQIQTPRDDDKVRLTLSAEAGLNDGTAFPFVVLGLGLLGRFDLGRGAWHWLLIDVTWAVLGGLLIGGGLGYGLGRLLLRVQARRSKAIAFGEYLVLGLIGVSYGAAILAHAYGFLAVFAAGLALRAVERMASPTDAVLDRNMAAASGDELAANPKTAPAYFAGVLLATNEQLEHLFEVGIVLIVGAMLMSTGFSLEALWFAPLLFLVIRPIAALPVLAIGPFSKSEFGAIAWFGIRGIGSLYYLMFAIEQGLPEGLARRIASLTLTIIALSIVIHGVSVTPLFERYSQLKKRSARRASGSQRSD